MSNGNMTSIYFSERGQTALSLIHGRQSQEVLVAPETVRSGSLIGLHRWIENRFVFALGVLFCIALRIMLFLLCCSLESSTHKWIKFQVSSIENICRREKRILVK